MFLEKLLKLVIALLFFSYDYFKYQVPIPWCKSINKNDKSSSIILGAMIFYLLATS